MSPAATTARPSSATRGEYTVIDADAPCGWCGSTTRPRIQRGPSLLGYQCVDADACNADHRAWREKGGRA